MRATRTPRPMHRFRALWIALVVAAVIGPVPAIRANTVGLTQGAPQPLTVFAPGGSGRLLLYVSRDWSVPQPDIVRAVITVHGEHRDADRYDAIARDALARAGAAGQGTLLVTPRFAGGAAPDEAAPDRLRWPGNGWMDGAASADPSAVSSFAALDAIVARLSDRVLFPRLHEIVLVGHSAGGQLVQHYAVLGHGEARAAAVGIAMRHVVANPSSYAYFSPDRPTADGHFVPYPVDVCPDFDRWKYGMQELPSYAGDARPADLERDYVRRDVTILLGALDTDPELRALDHSCAAEAQGESHAARGHDFFRYLQSRHPTDLRQRLHDVAGVGHDAAAMLTSACALAAIYDTPPCAGPASVAAMPAASDPSPAASPPPVPPRVAIEPVPRHRAGPARPSGRVGGIWQPGGWVWTGLDYVRAPGHWLRRPRHADRSGQVMTLGTLAPGR